MKTRGWLVAAILSISVPVYTMAQCGGTIQTITYDTTVSGNGITNTPYRFTFPKLPASAGTLMSVHLASVITLTYGYSVENSDPVPRANLRVRINRSDEITSPFITPDPYDYLSPNYTHNIGASDGVTGSGPDFQVQPPLHLRNGDTAFSEVSYSADFIGNDSVWFDYATSLGYSVANGSASVLPQATDEVKFSITYTYCDNIMLAPGATRIRREQADAIKNRIAPNPSHTGNFTIYFDKKTRGDWQVELYSTGGQLVNRKLFYNALNANVNNDKKLERGVYIVKALNLKSREGFVERLVVK